MHIAIEVAHRLEDFSVECTLSRNWQNFSRIKAQMPSFRHVNPKIVLFFSPFTSGTPTSTQTDRQTDTLAAHMRT